MTDTIPELYCANHPKVSTSLRCNRCEKPICVKCAVSTPTGYRCKECVRGLQKTFDTTVWYDYVTSLSISAILSFIGSRIVPSLGFFTIFLTPIAGVIIAEIVRAVLRKRRSLRLFRWTATAVAVGSLPFLLINLISALAFISQGGLGMLFGIVWQAVYTFTITTTVYYRLSGIRM